MIASGTDSRPAVRIRLSGRVTGELIDNELTTVVGTDASWRSDVIVDLSDVSYIDVAALMHVLAVLSDRERQGLDTYIDVPSEKRVRDFLRAWSFPTTAAMLAGRPFRQLVLEERHSVFGEVPTYYTGIGSRSARTAIVAAYDRLLRDRFFSFVTYRFGSHSQASEVVEREWRRWTQPIVLSLLDTVLDAPGIEVPRVIVHELIANAIQHPEARTATLVARPVGLNNAALSPRLTIAIWDDGLGIVDTLRRAAAAGSLRASAPSSTEPDMFQLSTDGSAQRRLVSADLAPGRDSEDDELLLASLFPGISRKYSMAVPDVAARTTYDGDSSSYGFGLHSLYRCVIDAFGGTLAVRTGSHFMKVTRLRDEGASQKRKYAAEVKMLPGVPFRGNLIFVRLPINVKINSER